MRLRVDGPYGGDQSVVPIHAPAHIELTQVHAEGPGARIVREIGRPGVLFQDLNDQLR